MMTELVSLWMYYNQNEDNTKVSNNSNNVKKVLLIYNMFTIVICMHVSVLHKYLRYLAIHYNGWSLSLSLSQCIQKLIYMRIDFLNTPLCLCVSLFVYVCADCLSSKGEDRLFRRLFRRYNQFIRPVENVSDPVTVEFEVSMSQLVKVVRQTIILETHDPMLKLCLNKGAIPWKRFVRSRIKRNVYLKKKSVSYGLSNYTWLKEKRKHTLLVVFTGEIVAVCCCWLFWFFV